MPLWFGVWLAPVLIAAKALMFSSVQPNWQLSMLPMASFEDVLFAVGLGVVGQVGFRVVRSRSTLAAYLRRTLLVLCAFCAAYSVIAVVVFEYFDRPLTYDLLRLIGNIRTVQSSVTQRVTMPRITALLVVPVVFTAGAMLFGRNRRALLGGLGAACIWVSMGLVQHTLRPDDLPDMHLHLNPHLELFRSTFVGLTKERRPTLPEFSPEDAHEFRSFGARSRTAQNNYQPPEGVDRPQNVIVVVLESVGAKYLSLYGSPYDTTPNLMSEAAHALIFDNFYAQAPYTYYSFRPINFSIYPGLPWCYAPWAGRPLPPALASVIRPIGWRTAYLNNCDLDWSDQRWMLESSDGYEALFDYRDMDCALLTSAGVEDRCLFDRLIRWIDEERDRPFLAVCWTDQTHDPYATSPGAEWIDFFAGRDKPRHADDLGKYLNVIRETDRHLGRLFAALRQRGLSDNTLVAITADHGEAFADPHEQRFHGWTLYEEELRIPLMLWNPRLFAPGGRVASVGSQVDLNPTIADILGIEPPAGWQGHSLFDPARPPRAFFLTNIGEYQFGVREGRWKYILNATDAHEMLFDLSRDSDEQHNLAQSEPRRCRRLRQRIAAWVSFEEEFLRGLTD